MYLIEMKLLDVETIFKRDEFVYMQATDTFNEEISCWTSHKLQITIRQGTIDRWRARSNKVYVFVRKCVYHDMDLGAFILMDDAHYYLRWMEYAILTNSVDRSFTFSNGNLAFNAFHEYRNICSSCGNKV